MGSERVEGIEIIAPPVDTLLSPDDARAWVGVRMPFAPSSNRNHPTKYYVEASMAVHQLRKANPIVAHKVEELYQKSPDTALGLLWFSFEKEICKQVELHVEYT